MKKIALILMISMYAFSSFGIGIKQFYCCGKLKSTSFSFIQDAKKLCKESGCCKTTFHSLKIKDSHIGTDAINNTTKFFSETLILHPSHKVVYLVEQQSLIINTAHAPPLLNGLPLYISYCVYRI